MSKSREAFEKWADEACSESGGNFIADETHYAAWQVSRALMIGETINKGWGSSQDGYQAGRASMKDEAVKVCDDIRAKVEIDYSRGKYEVLLSASKNIEALED